MPLLKSKTYTIDDIYALPENQRAELIDGQIYDMAPPGRVHQEILFQISRIIGNYILDNNGNCKIYPAPFAVFLKTESKNYVEPDISVICDKDKLDDKGCNGAPDWIIEIVSPNNSGHDYVRKLNLYWEAGVHEYWIVDPINERTHIYNFENDQIPVIIPFNQDITSNIFTGLNINISELLNL